MIEISKGSLVVLCIFASIGAFMSLILLLAIASSFITSSKQEREDSDCPYKVEDKNDGK